MGTRKKSEDVTILTAQVMSEKGTVAAFIELVQIGGGSQTVTVDGVPEERVHPTSSIYHVRCISPDRMVPDQLISVDSYEEACALAVKYAQKMDEHADRVAALADDLKIDG